MYNILFLTGNYPLHLAAWNGHADVARVLINTGPSRANVNEQASYMYMIMWQASK